VYIPIKNVRCCYVPVSTAFVWRKLVETIERVGWISGILAALFTLASFLIKDLPSGLQYIPIGVAGIILSLAAYHSHITKKRSKEKKKDCRFFPSNTR
jgi:Na+/proline symporter